MDHLQLQGSFANAACHVAGPLPAETRGTALDDGAKTSSHDPSMRLDVAQGIWVLRLIYILHDMVHKTSRVYGSKICIVSNTLGTKVFVIRVPGAFRLSLGRRTFAILVSIRSVEAVCCNGRFGNPEGRQEIPHTTVSNMESRDV